MMSFAVAPGCGSEMLAVRGATRGSFCAGGVAGGVSALAACLDSRGSKVFGCAGALGSAVSGFGGSGFGSGATGAGAGLLIASAAGAGAGLPIGSAAGGGAMEGYGAAAGAGAAATAGVCCVRLAAVGGSLEPCE